MDTQQLLHRRRDQSVLSAMTSSSFNASPPTVLTHVASRLWRAASYCYQMSRTSSERFSGVKNLPTTSSDASNFGLISEVAKIS